MTSYDHIDLGANVRLLIRALKNDHELNTEIRDRIVDEIIKQTRRADEFARRVKALENEGVPKLIKRY